MSGLVGTGTAFRRIADNALSDVAVAERARTAENRQIKAGHSAQKASLAGTGAALGWTLGSAALGAQAGMWGGPIGMGVGAAAGYLIGEFL